MIDRVCRQLAHDTLFSPHRVTFAELPFFSRIIGEKRRFIRSSPSFSQWGCFGVSRGKGAFLQSRRLAAYNTMTTPPGFFIEKNRKKSKCFRGRPGSGGGYVTCFRSEACLRRRSGSEVGKQGAYAPFCRRNPCQFSKQAGGRHVYPLDRKKHGKRDGPSTGLSLFLSREALGP